MEFMRVNAAALTCEMLMKVAIWTLSLRGICDQVASYRYALVTINPCFSVLATSSDLLVMDLLVHKAFGRGDANNTLQTSDTP